jgi:hypothetical protein
VTTPPESFGLIGKQVPEKYKENFDVSKTLRWEVSRMNRENNTYSFYDLISAMIPDDFIRFDKMFSIT